MDQEPLVNEQVEAGKEFIAKFNEYVPVHAAFWLKATEDSSWYLYVASDRINDQNFDVAYGEVLRLAPTLEDPNFDPFRVKVIGVDDPLAKAALAVYKRSAGRVPTRVRASDFGPMGAEAVYLYPPLIAAVRA